MRLKDPICIYHGNCADGFTAAWAVWKRLGAECKYYPATYQNPPPDVTGRSVIMVDFCYKRTVLEQMCQPRGAHSMLIIDHHKTAEADLAGLGHDMAATNMNFADYLGEVRTGTAVDYGMGAPVYKVFDMARSGAGLAWDCFQMKPRPRLVAYVEDRDLWKFELPYSRDVNANIFASEYSFHGWDDIESRLENGFMAFANEGAAIERKHHKDIRELTKAMRYTIIAGHLVPVVNLPYTLASDAAHAIAAGQPFGASYWDTPDGRVFSLRSRTEGLDVSDIAKEYGGGGHKHAAGFRVGYDHPLANGRSYS